MNKTWQSVHQTIDVFQSHFFSYHDNHVDPLCMQRRSCWIKKVKRDVFEYVLSFVDVLVNVFKSLLRLGIRWWIYSQDSTSYCSALPLESKRNVKWLIVNLLKKKKPLDLNFWTCRSKWSNICTGCIKNGTF